MDRCRALWRLKGVPSRLGALALAVAAVVAVLAPAGAQADSCPNAEFRTGPSANLPDCRAYEKVTPADTNNGEVNQNLSGFIGVVRAAPTEGRVAYVGTQAFGDVEGMAIAAVNLANRGAGAWLTHGIQAPQAPNAALAYGGQMLAITPDLAKEVVVTNIDPTTHEPLPGGAPFQGAQAIYLRDNATATYRFITSVAPAPSGGQVRIGAAMTPDGSSILIGTRVLASGTFTGALEHFDVATGQRQNVAILPDDSASASAQPAAFQRLSRHEFSDDGNIAFFRDDASKAVYRRDLGAQSTVAINASENTGQTVPLGAATFGGASTDGSLAYFSSDQPLVDGDANAGSDLYRYDAAKPAGQRLTALTSGGTFKNVVAVTDDGRRVYFVDSGELVPGVPSPPSLGGNLYLWDDSGSAPVIKYVATLSSGDVNKLSNSNVPIAADGRYLAFLGSTPGITPEDTDGHAQAYLYDADGSTAGVPDVVCASCLAPPAASTAAAEFEFQLSASTIWGVAPRRNLSDAGQLFFETPEALVPTDTNDRLDVYEYEDGQIHLLSTGRGTYDTYFGDATPSGDDVYIYTPNRLTAQDNAELSTLYDVRVGGGFPVPAAVAPCVGDGCHGAAPAAPGLPVAATVSFAGSGNVVERSSQGPAKRVGKVRAARRVTVRRGAFRLKVRTPAAGRITAGGPRVRTVRRTAAKAATYRLRVRLTRRALRRLARHGVVRLRVRVAFRPRQGTASSAVVRVTVRRPAARSSGHRGRVAGQHRARTAAGHRSARGDRAVTAKGGR